MNPFNWNGPEFLAFYLILSVALFVAQIWMRRTRETEAYNPASTPKLTDPYLVAYLSGGVNGMLRCVTVMLIERKVLTIVVRPKGKDDDVVMDPSRQGLIQSPLESAVARAFVQARPAPKVFARDVNQSAEVVAAMEQYQAQLEAGGLLPTPGQRSSDLGLAWTVTIILAVVAILKVDLAIERGHRNVGFLIALAFISCIVSLVVTRRRLTRPGIDAVKDLRTLFHGLEEKTRTGCSDISPADVAFVSAIFGLGALGMSRQVYGKSLFPAASSSSGCGSSCGSSSSGGGDGGGSGCGGGGCGGCGGS